MELGWQMPQNGYIKVNVHSVYYNNPLPNANNSGIGVVLRNDTGDVILMVSGTIRNLTGMANDLWAMLVGLRCAFYEKKYKVELETESAAALREWDEWRWFHDPNHRRVIQQLDHRQQDKRLKLTKKIIGESQNGLARFLAVDGAQNRTRLVVFRRPFGLAREIWHVDMGLGTVNGDFDLLEEEEYLQIAPQEINEDLEGVGEWLLQDEGSANVHNAQ